MKSLKKICITITKEEVVRTDDPNRALLKEQILISSVIAAVGMETRQMGKESGTARRALLKAVLSRQLLAKMSSPHTSRISSGRMSRAGMTTTAKVTISVMIIRVGDLTTVALIMIVQGLIKVVLVTIMVIITAEGHTLTK